MSQPFFQPNLVVARSPKHTANFWIVLVGTGVAAGLAGGVLMRVLQGVQHVAWGARGNEFAAAVERASATRHVVNLLIAGALVGVGGTGLRRWGGKETAEVNEAVWLRDGRVATGKAICQGLLSIVNVGLGMSLGREAAIKQAGGAAGSQLGEWVGLNADERRLLVACGVGAGMAAAYNVPLGGALFAVEVLLGTLSLPTILPALIASALATATSWLLLPAQSVYQITAFPLSVSQCVWAALVGPVLGVAAVALVRGIGWAGGVKPKGRPGIAVPVAVFAVLGLVSIKLPLLLGNGQDAAQLAFTGRLSVRSLAILPEAKWLAVLACLAGGGSGGLFTPSMTIGALLGGLLGSGWAMLWPGVPLGSCAVIGASAVLAASTQGPLSSLVLVMELTQHIDPTMVPLLLAVTGATLTARRFESRTVYTIRLAAAEKVAPPVRPAEIASSVQRSVVG